MSINCSGACALHDVSCISAGSFHLSGNLSWSACLESYASYTLTQASYYHMSWSLMSKVNNVVASVYSGSLVVGNSGVTKMNGTIQRYSNDRIGRMSNSTNIESAESAKSTELVYDASMNGTCLRRLPSHGFADTSWKKLDVYVWDGGNSEMFIRELSCIFECNG